jgi:copper(I)-binding protein
LGNTKIFVLIFFLIAPQSLFATAIVTKDAWVRLPRGHAKMTGAFISLTNTQKIDDELTSVTCECAGTAEVHETTQHQGMMKMNPIKALGIKAGETVALKPGSFHIMLIGIKKPLKAEDTVKLQFQFKHAGPVTVEAKVKAN